MVIWRRSAVLLLASLLVACGGRAPLTGGPLQTDVEYGVETHAGSGGVVSWGLVLPAFNTGDPAVIDAIEPESITGLTVLAVLASDPKDRSIGTLRDWPSPSSEFATAIGSVVPAGGRLQVIFVLHLDARAGTISGVRIRYRQGATRYEASNQWWVRVSPAKGE